jgi:hypothetical protein
MESLAEALSRVRDHRSKQGQRHELTALLLLVCTGMLCGCRSLQALTAWGKRQEGSLLVMMGFKRGQAPGYGTLQRCLSHLDVDSFEQVLSQWGQQALKDKQGHQAYQGLAVDGKTLRGSRVGELPGVQVLSVLAHQLGIVLNQATIPPQTNEYKVSLPLLTGLNLTNQVVTADAMFMQREVCHFITQQHGHYLIVLKDHQPNLRQNVVDWFEPFPPAGRVPVAVCPSRQPRTQSD